MGNEMKVRARKARRLAKAIGWFSIGLGTAQLLRPDSLARMIGIRSNSSIRMVMRAMGVREIGHGLAILVRPTATAAMGSRIAGDALDLALLGAATTSPKADLDRLGAAAVAVAGVSALDVFNTIRLARTPSEAPAEQRLADPGIHVTRALTIRKPIHEVYAFWQDFSNLPSFMSHLEDVEVIDDRRSRWRTNAPAGRTISWNAEITADIPNERIEWRSIDGGAISHRGEITFHKAPGDRGTEVRVNLRYDPPAGKLGKAAAILFGEAPEQQIQDDLFAFKQVMETGVLTRSEGTMGGRFLQHPAQMPKSEAAV